ncbi:hypothetical protein [Steroidobacter agaridevorans]|uniref:hypothetical protein n=1 Tax=Steroidobacter agaridevorans TaxID=2695856 RepID=UPI00137975A6|nr:hypothetical protein [Steroidobacter agaridevorans]
MPWKQIGRGILKGLGWLTGGALALVASCYIALLLINLRDQPPSEFALRLEDIYRNRPAVADADNGYIYVMGFSAAPEADPHEMGLQRVAWLRHRAEHPEDQSPSDPLPGEYQSPQLPAFEKIRDACGWGANSCDRALAESDATLPEWLPAEQWRVDRYRTLLARPGWLETLPPDVMMPLPAYAPVLDAQRLLLVKAHSLAGQQDADGVREILERDVHFWRGVLTDSDILISRMIAVAALSRHFSMGNLALRRLPPEMQWAAMPEAWRAPFTADELSWHRCFAGEWLYARSVLSQIATGPAAAEAALHGENYGFLTRLQDLAIEPLFQLQDTTNQSAEMLVRAADALQVPIEQFTEARTSAAEIFSSSAARVGTVANLYNPVGDMLASVASGSYDSYPPRVADVEGARRAAVLATELRSRKVDVANIRAEIEASALRMPYTGAPFVWDSKAQAILFIGLVPGERGQHSFKY